MTKSYKEIKRLKEESNFQVQEACWDGYKQVGMKKKGDRMVPNCIKEEIVHAVFGKDYIHREPIMETGVGDMYKGKLNKDQLATIKNTWKNKKQTDVTQGVKDMIRGYDAFTRMDIKQANIKYLSALINDEVQHEEVDFISPLQDQIEIVEMNSVVRKTELKEFTTDQINKLAKSYADMAGKTISLPNAQRLQKMFDRVPDSSLNALRKKKIPFLSGLALSRMIQKKIPVTESAYEGDEYAVSIAGIETDRQVLDEGLKLAKLVGKSIAHLDMYVELANDVKKIPIGDISSWLKSKAEQASKSVPPLIKDLRKPGIWNEELQEAVKAVKFWEDKQLEEADLSKSQVKQVHKQADELPKKDFIKRYGKDGDAVRYATATNQVKNKLGLGENRFKLKGELTMNESYKTRLTSAMEHYKIDSLAELKDEDQKPFFAYVDGLKEELSAAQKKLPPALQKAIAAKQGDKKEDDKEDKKEVKETLKKEVEEEEVNVKERMGANTPSKPNRYKQYLKKTGQKLYKNELSPKQKQLDKDKDGDIGADDLAKLRATKKEKVIATKQVSEDKKYLQTKPGSLEEAILKSRGLNK